MPPDQNNNSNGRDPEDPTSTPLNAQPHRPIVITPINAPSSDSPNEQTSHLQTDSQATNTMQASPSPTIDTSSIYPDISRENSLLHDSHLAHPGTDSNSKNKKSKKLYKLLVPLLIIGLCTGIAGYYILYKNDENSKENTAQRNSVSYETVESSLDPKTYDKLEEYTLPLYIPENMTIEKGVFAYDPVTIEKSFYSYGVNLKFGQGLVKGSYGFYVYPKSDTYNPPDDCSLPGVFGKSATYKCELFVGSNETQPAYVYNGGIPGGIQNADASGKVSKKISMYMERNGSIIRIETSDTSAEELYNILLDMTEITAQTLPSDTSVIVR